MNKTGIFVVKAKEIHGDMYDYSLTDYVHCQQNVVILCKEHGAFNQQPNSHLNGRGCIKCYRVRQSKTRRLPQSEFIERALAVFGNVYDYSKVEYETNNSVVVIGCKDHGDFNSLPSEHMKGRGCPACSRLELNKKVTSTTSAFVKKSVGAYGELYDYSKVNYKRSNQKVEIVCKHHGSFFKTPANHLFGQGCPDCADYGYRKGLPGSFYILHEGNTTKVGITNRGAKIRCKDITKSSRILFQIICELKFQDGSIPQSIERDVLSWLRLTYKPADATFDGSTECFLNVDLSTLLDFVTPLATPELAQANHNTRLAIVLANLPKE